MPKVSVVVPVYNVEKYLFECLNSIVNQSLRDIEIICVDDGSTDKSVNILNTFAQNDDRVIVLQQENKGAACARNQGMSLARGEYIIFLDSDDYFDLDMLRKSYEKSVKYDADICIFKAKSFDTRSGKLVELNDRISNFSNFQDMVFSANDIPDDIFNSFLIPAWNKLYKRDFLFKHIIKFQDIKRTNDLYFTNKTLILAKKMILIDEYLLYYRIGLTNNLQAGNKKTPLAFYEALYELKQFLEEGKYQRFRNSYIKLALEIIFYNLYCLKDGEYWDYVVEKLGKEGFEILGVSQCRSLKKTDLLLYLQYLSVLNGLGKRICCLLYLSYKFKQYYKLTGFNNAILKVFNKR